MKITDAEIRKIVKEAVKRTMLIKEAENLTALRRLIIKAEQTALDFEKNIVNELDLISPDSMDEKTQRVYLHIVASLKRSLVSAVIDAAKELNKLPKEKQKDVLAASNVTPPTPVASIPLPKP